jgi:hypothetical protein
MFMKRLRFFAWSSPCPEVAQQAFVPARSSRPVVESGARGHALGERAQLWLAFLVVLLAAWGTWSAGNWMLAAWQWQ